jgi:hypothetical protein
MSNCIVCTIVLVGSIGSLYDAVVQAEPAAGPLAWLDDNKITIRKTFNGTAKDANSPAAFSYENPDTGDTFVRVDLAVKTPAIWELDSDSDHGVRLVPALEYHRSTKDFEETNKQSGALTLEYEYEFDSFGLVSDLKYELNHDSVLDTTTRAASLYLALSGDEVGWPDHWLRRGPDQLEFFRYFPSIGLERYAKLPIKQKQGDTSVVIAPDIDAEFAFARVSMELRAFPVWLDGRLILVASYTQRWRVGGADAFVPSNTGLVESSLDYYLDEKKRIGIGLSYQRGEDPNRNFLDEEFSALGLKIKVGS